MSNTYTQIHLQFIFAVKYRKAQISPKWKGELFQYITGIIQNNGHKLIVINGMPDHLHIFVGMRPTQSISKLLQDIKGDSSKWINKNRYTISKFAWQEGYGAFSYSKSHMSNVINYINNQEMHNAKKSLKEEYIDFLKRFDIEYNEEYIFQDLE